MIQINEDFEPNSDSEIEQNVRAFLEGCNMPALRRLAVSVSAGTVTLRGQVRTFYERQLTQQCLRRIAGVRQLIDRTVVNRDRNDLVPGVTSVAENSAPGPAPYVEKSWGVRGS